MFSMFGRTEAPQKGAPIKGAANFCMPEKWVTPSETRVMSKKLKKVASFFEEI